MDRPILISPTESATPAAAPAAGPISVTIRDLCDLADRARARQNDAAGTWSSLVSAVQSGPTIRIECCPRRRQVKATSWQRMTMLVVTAVAISVIIVVIVVLLIGPGAA